jgi:hypothetical protein
LGDRNLKARLSLKTPWVRYAVYVLGGLTLVGLGALTYLFVSYSRLIDARLEASGDRTLPRVYAGRSSCIEASRSASRSSCRA